MKIAVKDRAEAESWKVDCEDLNRRAEEAVKKAAQIVKEIKEMADGTLIDELFELGGTLSSVAVKLFEAMNKILETVNSLLNAIEDLIEKGKSFISDAAGALIG